MQTKRKTDLFRFVTLRAPQLISKEKRTIGFIEHPNPSISHFLKDLSTNDFLPVKRSKVQVASASFAPFTSVEAIKALSEEVWEYSLWLANNKYKLDRTTIEANIPATLLTPAQMITIWDNVFYDILERKNPYIRQACLQLIVSVNFAENFKTYSPVSPIPEANFESEMSALKRLANGKVVINDALSSAETETAIEIGYNQFEALKQCPIHKAKLAELRTPVLDGMKKELVALSKTYTQEYERAFNTEKIKYESEVDKVVSAYLAKIPNLSAKVERVERTSLIKKEVVNDSETVTEKRNLEQNVSLELQLPDDLVKQFNFQFVAPLSDDYTNGKLSKTALAFIRDRGFEQSTIDVVLSELDRQIYENGKIIAQSKRRNYKEVMINGIQTRKSAHTPNDFAISFHDRPVSGEYPEKALPEIYFSMNTGYNGAFLTDAKFTIAVDGKTRELDDVKILSTTDRTVLVKLSNTKEVPFETSKPFDFQASFKLDNGTEYRIAKKGYVGVDECVTGIAIPFYLGGPEVHLYGINRIGVADFRRVEQELCCYVAGEVSHIENILAREYKERSTRNLTSSETTIESITERESEESTDTTSATRFEMSSEIAEVLEKDRNSNFGFSAGTSGEYGKTFAFNANAYGDFSFGQSSSESNSSAQSYAEDVTRRALERIVQRTSLKRTSRILREFEENNRHGYDNRDGDEHVTGVFRWIDKVYKNRIVNYGKRLVYEFMIPEPARFYKDAIIIKAEEEEVTTSGGGNTGSTNVAVKPEHPSVHGLNSLNDIKRDDYQQKAAIYGVSPTTPPDQNKTLTKSYSENIGGADAEKSFNYPPDMTIPMDYHGCEVKFSVSYKYTARTGAKAYIRVSAAGQSWTSSEYRGEGSDSATITRAISGVTGAVSVSVVSKKMREFQLSVTVKCCLLQSVEDAWKRDVYEQIMDAYQTQLDAYNAAQNTGTDPVIVAAAENKDTQLNLNPKFNAQVVMTELKRLCIEMLTRPFGITQGRDLLDKGACEVPMIKLGPLLDIYGSQVKFFEQAFDWDLMAQMFYPYYWAKRCDWKELFQSQVSDDHIFQAFLQSGMSRVVVPVREGFEDAVTYYMETGEIWNGIGLALDTDDELYISIMEEMTGVEGTVEGAEWETVVPSSLTIVQARSAYLDEEGLPCCESDAKVLDQLNIEASTALLIRKADA